MIPPRAAPERLSRRRLLSRLSGLGLFGLAAATSGCGVPNPSALVRGFMGQAQQATGAAPPPKVLRWVTPIPQLTPVEARKEITSFADSLAIGWARMLGPWQTQHPDITIIHQVVAPSDLTQQQLALAGSDTPIDLAYTDVGYQLGQAGVIDPLDLGALGREIVPVALEAQSSGIQVYAFPIFLSILGLYANKGRLTAASLDPAQPLRDWASFETGVQKLTNRAKKQYGFDVFGSGSPLSGEMRYGPFLWTAGGNFFNGTGDQATWNEQPGQEALIFLARLSQNYASPGAATADDSALQGNWLSGQTATILAGPELTIDADRRGLSYVAQSVPAYIQGQASSLATSAGAIGVFAQSRHKDWGLDLSRYLAGKDAQVTGLATIPLLPANSGAADASPVFSHNPILAQFLRILREDDVHALPRPRAHQAEVEQIFRAYLGIALQGLATPETAWNTSAAQATALIRSAVTPTPHP